VELYFYSPLAIIPCTRKALPLRYLSTKSTRLHVPAHIISLHEVRYRIALKLAVIMSYVTYRPCVHSC
jgi:hypothetical protein